MSYMNVQELSGYIKLSKSSIYKRVMNNQIPFIKANGKLLFRQETIDQWLEKYSHATTGEISSNIYGILKPQRKVLQ